MTKSFDIRQQRLENLESEFRSALPPLLKECAAQRWGLFGQYDHVDGGNWADWPEAEHLKNVAREIRSMRQEYGQTNSLVERFFSYYSLRGPNVPGEPKLAQALLDEIEFGTLSM